MSDRRNDEMPEEDLDQPSTRRDIRALDKSLCEEMILREAAIRAEIRARDERIDERFDELRRHFDLIVESFKTEFRNLYDWTHATTSALSARLDHVENDHGTRLLSVETRVTRLERRRKSNGR
jgi:hypothetical protein